MSAPSTFSIGVKGVNTLSKYDRRGIKKRGRLIKLKQMPIYNSSKRKSCFYAKFNPKCWLIIPCMHLSMNVRILLTRSPTFKDAMDYIKSKRPRRRFYNLFTLFERHDLIPGISDYLLGITNNDIKEAVRLAYLNESVRRRLSALARRWIRSKMKPVNDEDLVTMEAPKREITLYDWNARMLYRFEATTILRCIVRRITTHETLFTNPLEPVNPYTNLRLSLGHLHHIIDRLRHYGLTHWTLEGLRSVSYDWQAFILVYEQRLQLESLKLTFMDKTSPQLRELIFSFIESEYSINDKEFDEPTYKWALLHTSETPHIKEWHNLCYAYYYTEIAYKQIPLKGKMIYELAFSVARYKNIFNIPLSIKNRMKQWHDLRTVNV